MAPRGINHIYRLNKSRYLDNFDTDKISFETERKLLGGIKWKRKN